MSKRFTREAANPDPKRFKLGVDEKEKDVKDVKHETYVCQDRFLRQCTKQSELKREDRKQHEETFDTKERCEESCRLPSVLDRLTLQYIGQPSLYDTERFAFLKETNEYKINAQVEASLLRLEFIYAKKSNRDAPWRPLKPRVTREVVKHIQTLHDAWKQKEGYWRLKNCVAILMRFTVFPVFEPFIFNALDTLRENNAFNAEEWLFAVLTFLKYTEKGWLNVERYKHDVLFWLENRVSVLFTNRNDLQESILELFTPHYREMFEETVHDLIETNGLYYHLEIYYTDWNIEWAASLARLPLFVQRQIIETVAERQDIPFAFTAFASAFLHWIQTDKAWCLNIISMVKKQVARIQTVEAYTRSISAGDMRFRTKENELLYKTTLPESILQQRRYSILSLERFLSQSKQSLGEFQQNANAADLTAIYSAFEDEYPGSDSEEDEKQNSFDINAYLQAATQTIAKTAGHDAKHGLWRTKMLSFKF
jgi:hypothetical protein